MRHIRKLSLTILQGITISGSGSKGNGTKHNNAFMVRIVVVVVVVFLALGVVWKRAE